MSKPSPEHYFSLGQKSCGRSEPDLELHVKYQGDKNVEINVVNLQYQINKKKYTKRLLAIVTVLGIYVAFENLIKWNDLSDKVPYILGALILMLIQTLCSMLQLVRSEKLTYVWKKALQLKTTRTFARQSIVYIRESCIHDLVINEVIENLGVKYILIVRTKDELFKVRPIIPLLKNIEPSIECLICIYRLLKKVMPSDEIGAGDVTS